MVNYKIIDRVFPCKLKPGDVFVEKENSKTLFVVEEFDEGMGGIRLRLYEDSDTVTEWEMWKDGINQYVFLTNLKLSFIEKK